MYQNCHHHYQSENPLINSQKLVTMGTLVAMGYNDLANDYDFYYVARFGVANTLHTAICLTFEELSKSGYSNIAEKLLTYYNNKLTIDEQEIAIDFFEENFSRLKTKDAMTKRLMKRLTGTK
jgi:hypothetical protein